MFASLDTILRSSDEFSSSTTSNAASRQPPVPDRIIVTEDGIVREIEQIGVFEERGRKRNNSAPSRRYYARYAGQIQDQPTID